MQSVVNVSYYCILSLHMCCVLMILVLDPGATCYTLVLTSMQAMHRASSIAHSTTNSYHKL